MKKSQLLKYLLLINILFSSSTGFADETNGIQTSDTYDSNIFDPAEAEAMRGSESEESTALAAASGQVKRLFYAKKNALRNRRSGVLSGKRLSLSPGHGYLRENSKWRWQRGINNELREDIHTYEWMNEFLRPMLERAGADILMLRAYTFTESSIYMDTTSPEYTETGKWSKSSSGDYRYSQCNTSEDATAKWTFSVVEDGYYPIYVRYYTGENRTTRAKYIVEHERGDIELFENQALLLFSEGTSNGNTITLDSKKSSTNDWHYIGEFPFKTNKTYSITLSNESTESGKVVISDAVIVGDGPGTMESGSKTSGFYKWQESAESFMGWLGLPKWVHNGDVSGRCLYSLYEGVDAQFSFHTNAASGTARGTSTWVWYPSASDGTMQQPNEKSWAKDHATKNLPPGTYEYAKLIENRFVDYIRAYVDSEWKHLGGTGIYGSNFGELRPIRNAWYSNKDNNPLIIPAALMEAAFHDNAADSSMIEDLEYRFYGARGIAAAIIQFFYGENALIPPLPPKNLTVVASGDKLLLEWTPTEDKVLPNSKPTKYNIYTSSDGLLFDTAPYLSVLSTQAEIPIRKGETLYVRVTAANEAGESLDSSVGMGRLGNLNQKRVLYVNGVDRQTKTVYDVNKDREFARIYGAAITHSNAGLGIDYTDDNAVIAQIKKNPYDLVIWATSETSTKTDVLPPEQRAQITQLRSESIPILISGAEIGYALSSTSYNSSTSYLADTFDVSYLSDDISPSQLRETESIAAPNFIDANLNFSQCVENGGKVGKKTADAICVEYPDVIAPVNGATSIINYASGESAGVISKDGKSIFVAFPLESITSEEGRICLISNLISQLLDAPLSTDCKSSEYIADKEDCRNQLDDDEDGRIDCDDSDCDAEDHCKQLLVEICDNNIDDDKDGQPDCQDPECKNHSHCKPVIVNEICDNKTDDDGDGLPDCKDPECANHEACKTPIEICNNDTDDDKNGKIDCLDPACLNSPYCPNTDITPVEICDNFKDDDNDGFTDCEDPECINYSKCLKVPPIQDIPEEICDNGVDDDGNGYKDCLDAACKDYDDCVNAFDVSTDDGCDCSIHKTSQTPALPTILIATTLLGFAFTWRRKKHY